MHTSNYRIEGFTEVGAAPSSSALARAHKVPLVHDLGSGTLVDLARYGLAPEPTVAEAVAEGADLVTFSGDKLLGGPQAGIIVGRKELVARDRQEPDEAGAAPRQDPARGAGSDAEALSRSRPAGRDAADAALLRAPARPRSRRSRRGLRQPVAAAVGDGYAVSRSSTARARSARARCRSRRCRAPASPSRPSDRKGAGRRLEALARRFRGLPVPVIGRIKDGALILDLRCLDDEAGFLAQLAQLQLAARAIGGCAMLRRSSASAAAAAGAPPDGRAHGRGRRRRGARRLRRPRSASGSPFAHAGVARAQNDIGGCFVNGWASSATPTLASNWLTLAAKAGDPLGQRAARRLLFQRRGRRARPRIAEEWYARAAKQGDAARAGHAELDAARRRPSQARLRARRALGAEGRRRRASPRR